MRIMILLAGRSRITKFALIIGVLFISRLSLNAFGATDSPLLENEYIIITVNENGSISFTDVDHDVIWGSDYPGWVELSEGDITEKIPLTQSEISQNRTGETLTVTFKGLTGNKLRDNNFEMQVNLNLKGKQLDIEIENLHTSYNLKSVEYPAHILTVSSGITDGYIVVPNLQGIMIPSRYDAGFMRYGQNVWANITNIESWWTFESGNLNMPWFGASQKKSNVFVNVITSSDCQLHLIGNAVVNSEGVTVNDRQGLTHGTRLSSGSPVWLSSMHKFSYPRKMRLELVTGGYVGMAKKYKEYAIKSGRFVTLKEKIIKNPEIEKIIGAPDIKIYCYTNRINNPKLKAWSEPILNGYSKVNTTFGQVANISNELKDMGIDKCMILLAGWNRMGYDREHVDMWPPAQKPGGVAGLKIACETVINNGFLFALHDNYDDFYPDAPSFDEKYIIRNEDGSLKRGGIWDGGNCYIICPAVRKELLDRNMDLIQNDIPLNGYYFDVITNTSHYECYDERHEIDRRQDLKYRLELLEDIRERGLVIGGERGTDWAMPAVAFCEGLSGGGTGYHYGVTYRTGITIPLFYLVYHDCVVGYWQHGTPYGREDHANHLLLDLLCTQPSSWSIEYDQWNDLKPVIKKTYELLGPLSERMAHLAMTGHQILSDDYMVQKSEFEDGTEIWVNFGITTYKTEEFILPPKGFRLKVSGENINTGSVTRAISYN